MQFVTVCLGALVAVLLFIMLACASAVVGAEAVSRTWGLAIWLLRQAARRLPAAEREQIGTDWVAELSSPELSERPLSAVVFALRVFVRAGAMARCLGKPTRRARGRASIRRTVGRLERRVLPRGWGDLVRQVLLFVAAFYGYHTMRAALRGLLGVDSGLLTLGVLGGAFSLGIVIALVLDPPRSRRGRRD